MTPTVTRRRRGFNEVRSRPLRPALHRDRSAMLAIWRSAVAATHDFVAAEDLAAIDREVADLLPHLPAIVAVDRDDRPIGFISADGPHLNALFVHATRHGEGVGRTLVSWLFDRHDVVTVDVNEQNAAALAFYLRLGFRPTGRSAHDDQGRPYPLLHLTWRRSPAAR